MTIRKFLLIFIPAAALLMFALLRPGPDDVSMAGADPLRAAPDPGRDVTLPQLPDVGANRATDAIELFPVHAGEVAALHDADASAALLSGHVTGLLVDGAGKPVAHEPVLLLLERDPWVRRPGRPNDNERPRQLLSSAESGEDGRFTLPARAGARLALLAGGTKWARSGINPVQAGDDLRIVLGEGRQLEGSVVDATSGTAVPNAWVLALAPDDQLMVRADESGHFTLGPLPDVNSVVCGWAPGFDVKLQPEVSAALGPITLELPAGRELKGHVVDRVTNQPVTTGGTLTLTVDVMARLAGSETVVATLPAVVQTLTATLDSDGAFSFPIGPSMGFDILTRAEGYVPDSWDRAETRPIGAGDELNIALWPLDSVAGVVTHAGSPSGGAAVRATSPSGQFFDAVAGEDGRFTLTLKDWDGERPVYVEATDTSGTLAARVRLGRAEDELQLQLVPALKVAVQVVRSGVPVPGAEVAALSSGAATTLARSGADGFASLTHPLAGPDVEHVRLQARAGDSQSLPLELDLKQPLPAPIVLDLDGGAFIEGIVSDIDGAPVASAGLTYRPDDGASPDGGPGNRNDNSNRNDRGPGGNNRGPGGPGGTDFGGGEEDDNSPGSRWSTARTDAAGHFRLGPLAADAVGTLVARARDFRDRSLPEVAAGTKGLVLQLDPVVRWEGRIVDLASGLPLKDWVAVLQQESIENGKASFKNTRDNVEHKPGGTGEFSVSLPARGRFQLRVSSASTIPANSFPVDFNGVQPPPFAVVGLSPAAVLEVTLLDARGRPVDGYNIAAIDWAKGGDAPQPTGDVRKGAKTARTDGAGRARFQLGEGGSYRIAGGPALWLDASRIDVQPGPAVTRSYTLPPTGDLEVTVIDEQGKPLQGVRIEVRSAKGETQHSVSRQTSARTPDGKVVMEGLPPGDYDVTSRRRGYDNQRQTVLIKGNLLERLSVVLKPRAPGS